MENEIYFLYNGEPMVNDDTFKVCPNKVKLIFNGGTTVSKMEIPEIPSHQFKVKSIFDFLTGKFSNDLLYGRFFYYVYLSRVIHSLTLDAFSPNYNSTL